MQISNYQVVETVYTGNRTLVYRAIGIHDQLPVVIKLLRNEYPTFSELVQFRNQYTIAKNLNSPLIIQTYSLEPYQNGYALIMEDFGGISLRNYFARNQRRYTISLEDFLEIAIDLCNTLNLLYQERIIHKDIKPANILINPKTKQVKLIDFSIASLLQQETQTLINPNVLEGTLAYISPEQTGRMNRGIDYRTDFYSLGVTFYELLTGELPFPSNDPMELIHSHIAKLAPLAYEINPEIPSVISKIVSKLMAKNAEDRYQSALGLKFDLENCLSQLQKTSRIDLFEIGQRDKIDRFPIPEKLYGREIEVNQLLAVFERVSIGAAEMMLVAGFSGIGKTAVVNEVHKPIARQRGYFIKGKYDQFQRNIPFSAFIQAFRDLMGQLLSESEAQLQNWKIKILKVVGDNGQVLIEVIPELEQIIGKQPPATELSASAAQNRFNLLIQKFVQAFTTIEHPLIIFLDDLQWADSASLQLLQLLMEDTGYLLILGAYRDNEVSPVHPFIFTVEEIIKTGATVNKITLQPLSLGDINQLIADTMNCELSLAQSLAELIYQKTQGNPFFATQFLRALHEDGQITFNWEACHWQCDITLVKALALVDDVVEFMALQLQKLPPQTQQMLKLAACIGGQFDLCTLVIISESSPEVTATGLWKALQEGLIIPNTEIYKFFMQSDSPSIAETVANPTYRFLHNHVQQAAYSLIPDDQKQLTHLKIGQLLASAMSQIEKDEKIFEIVNQFNKGADLIDSETERGELAKLNLAAAQRAKSATTYVAAIEYATRGIQVLPTNCWQQCYEITLALHNLAAEVACLSGNFRQMEQIVDEVLQNAQQLLDKVKVYEVKILAEVAQGQQPKAIKTALAALQLFDISFPEQPTEADHAQSLQQIQDILQGKDLADLLALPEMTDLQALAVMQILATVTAAVYQAVPELLPLIVCKQVRLSVEYGNAAMSAQTYAWYGVILCIIGEIDLGDRVGQLAMKLLSRFQHKEFKASTINMVYPFVKPWKHHIQESLAPLLEGYHAGLEVGTLEYAAYCAYNYCSLSFFLGKDLAILEPEMQVYSQALAQLKQEVAHNYLRVFYQSVVNLLNQSDAPWEMQGVIYDEQLMLPLHQQANDLYAMGTLYINKLILCCLFNEWEQATKVAVKVKQYLNGVSGCFMVPVFYFYDSLTHLAILSKTQGGTDDRLPQEVVDNQQKLKSWANHAPTNYLHKFYLVEAEQYRVLGQIYEAMDYYDRAIASAKENAFIQEESLANELAAKFYLDWGKQRIAGDYMIEAYYGYARWGAKAKVADLENRYPQLLAPILQPTKSPLSINETIFALESHTSSSAATPHGSSILKALDLAAILKASQALSGEIEMEKLLVSLLSIIIENAGADKCVFMLLGDDPLHDTNGERLLIKGSITEGSAPVVLQRIPVEESEEIPLRLIYKVLHSQQTVVLINASNDPTFANDPYILRQQPQSILCSPILHQGNLLGILYLENNLATGAFTSDRVELLNLLCAQAAISLENARLYERSRDYAQKLEQSLEELSAAQSRFHNLVDNVPGVVYQYHSNPDGVATLTYISADCYNLYEITPEQAAANVDFLTQMVHPEDLASYQQSTSHIVQTLSSWQWEGRIITPSGIVKWIYGESRIEQRADGSMVWDGLFLDISAQQLALQEQKRAEQELQKLAAVVENSTDFIGIVTIDGQALYLNPWGRLLVGLDSTVDISTMVMSDFHSQEEMAQVQQKIFPQVMQQGFSQTELCLQHLITKEQIPVDYSIFVVKDTQTGQPLYLTAICRDIRDRKQAEVTLQQKSQDLEKALKDLQQAQIQMIQSEKMSALGNLVAGIAHEINNPLGFIAGNLSEANQGLQDLIDYVQIYQEKFPAPGVEVVEKAEEIDLAYLIEDLPKMLESMQTGCDRIKFISKSLRTFSRADQDYKVLFDLHEGIDSTILILKHRLKANDLHPAIEVVTNYGDLPQVECFPGQMNQVFMNILANAIDTLEESNHERSFAEIEANPNKITITTTVVDQHVQISIMDNGKGMTEEVKNKVFDHLFTTKGVGKGTGLGLAIARQIVEEKHRGTILVNSELGIGTEFTIKLAVSTNIL